MSGNTNKSLTKEELFIILSVIEDNMLTLRHLLEYEAEFDNFVKLVNKEMNKNDNEEIHI